MKKNDWISLITLIVFGAPYVVCIVMSFMFGMFAISSLFASNFDLKMNVIYALAFFGAARLYNIFLSWFSELMTAIAKEMK